MSVLITRGGLARRETGRSRLAPASGSFSGPRLYTRKGKGGEEKGVAREGDGRRGDGPLKLRIPGSFFNPIRPC